MNLKWGLNWSRGHKRWAFIWMHIVIFTVFGMVVKWEKENQGWKVLWRFHNSLFFRGGEKEERTFSLGLGWKWIASGFNYSFVHNTYLKNSRGYCCNFTIMGFLYIPSLQFETRWVACKIVSSFCLIIIEKHQDYFLSSFKVKIDK